MLLKGKKDSKSESEGIMQIDIEFCDDYFLSKPKRRAIPSSKWHTLYGRVVESPHIWFYFHLDMRTFKAK